MRLRTLGKLALVNHSFKEPFALLILSYLALEGKTSRAHLAELFWPEEPDEEKKLSNIAGVIYRLKKAHSTLLTLDLHFVSSPVSTDANDFMQCQNAEAALEMYQGHFLAGMEHKKRLHLGEELSEWLFNTRERLHTRALGLYLEQAEALALEAKFSEAATLAHKAYQGSTHIAYPDPKIYRRLHRILLAANDLTSAEAVASIAYDVYDATDLNFLQEPFKARAYLRHMPISKEESLIGREHECARVLALLQQPENRLITVHGLSGIGKTVLAQELAKHARGQTFAKDGIFIAYFETLPAQASTQALLNQLGESLALSTEKDILLSTVTSVIADDSVLLVLDNLEHVLTFGRELIGTLLRTCPKLKLLVTSQQKLRLSGERVITLAPLSFPELADTLEVSKLQSFSALELFLRSAQKLDINLESKLPSVAKICQALAGLPLGIKLAAGWLNSLSLEQIARVLETSLDLAGNLDNPRHLSLAATFDYTIGLLSKTEQTQFISLGVFSGGFTLEAAEAMGLSINGLRDFLDRSLLRFHFERDRYDFHPLLSRYLQKKFEDLAEKTQCEESHARYYLNLLIYLMDESEQTVGVSLLKPEQANLAKAWRYASEQSWHEFLFTSSRALQTFAKLGVAYSFGDALLSYSLEKTSGVDSKLETALKVNLSALKYWLSDYETAIGLAKEALGSLETSAISAERQLSIQRLALNILQASYTELAYFDDALRVSSHLVNLLKEKAPASPAYANALTNLAVTEQDVLGNYDTKILYEALAIAEKQSPYDLPWILTSLARAFILQAELEKAEASSERARQLAESLGLDHWLAMSHYYLATIYLKQQKSTEALELCTLLLETVQKPSGPSLTALVYQLAGNIAMHRAEIQEAQTYYQHALSKSKEAKSICLTNSIKIDVFAWALQADTLIASQFKSELIKETTRMYAYDCDRLKALIG